MPSAAVAKTIPVLTVAVPLFVALTDIIVELSALRTTEPSNKVVLPVAVVALTIAVEVTRNAVPLIS